MTAPLNEDAIRRILLSLIAEAQGPLIQKGIVDPEQDIHLQLIDKTATEIDMLVVDETSLGFDSLSRLDLVLGVNQFFNLSTSGVDDYLLVRRKIGDWLDLISHHFSICNRDVCFSFRTSGSTGAPKTVKHHLSSLRAELDACISNGWLWLGPDARVLSMVPPHHIYGFLFSCLLPSMKDLQTIALHHRSPMSVFDKARPGDVVVATPYIWEKLADATTQFCSGVHGITSAGPSCAKTWSVLDRIGLSTLTEIYGATETAGIGYRRSFGDDFLLMSHLRRQGSQVYHPNAASGPLELQDRLIWSGPSTFSVDGRNDDIVQIAGVNVSPTHVARTINALSIVKAAYVRFDQGELKAFIVPAKARSDISTLENEIRTHIRANLAPAARPSEIQYGTNPPRNVMGKLRGWTVKNCMS